MMNTTSATPSIPSATRLAARFAVCMAAMATLAACASSPQARAADTRPTTREQGYWVRHVGSRSAIMERGDLSGQISLASLADTPHLYAVGPVEGLRGEVTVYDGKPSIATVEDDQPRVHASFDDQAIFLVYGSAAGWQAVTVDRPLSSHEEIEAFVRAAATDAGLDTDRPFPFRLEGRADTLQYHIMFMTGDAAHGHGAHGHGAHGHAMHMQARKSFELADADVQVVGFWADPAGEGVYTHPGQRTHLHFTLPDNATSGHVDELRLQAGTTLYLPR